MWADYFDREGVQYAFFSAINAAALQEARRVALEMEGNSDQKLPDTSSQPQVSSSHESTAIENGDMDDTIDDEPPPDSNSNSATDPDVSDEDGERLIVEEEDEADHRTRVLSVLELASLFEHAAPPLDCEY